MKILFIMLPAFLFSSGVTNRTTGNLGDRLLLYVKAKWVAHEKDTPFVFTPFEYAKDFNLSYAIDTHTFKKRKGLYRMESLDQGADTLYEVKYECEGMEVCEIPGLLQDTAFLHSIQKELTLKNTQKTPSTKGVALHYRSWKNDFLDSQSSAILPYKFPPFEYYQKALNTLLSFIDESYVHIFTDDPDPELLVTQFQEANPHLTFSYRAKATAYEDLAYMATFDYLIRPQSSFSQIAQLMGNPQIILYPKENEIGIHATLSLFDIQLAKIQNPHSPTLDDYRALGLSIQNDLPAPLAAGNDPKKKYYRLKKRFQFVIDEPPTLILSQGNPTQCIVSYSSCNPPYSNWIKDLPACLRNVEYEGTFRGHIGGWPNLQAGDLALANVPYAFKLCAIREAIDRGHKHIIWMDSALVPKRNFNKIFDILDHYGFFAVSTGATLKDLYDKGDFDFELTKTLGITSKELEKIPHVQGGFIGINAEHPNGQKIVDLWHEATCKKTPYISGFPEEIVLSTILYKLGLPPALKNSSMWQEDTKKETTRDPYFVLQTKRPD